MEDGKFEEICDFNICEEEREKDLGDYKALFFSESKLEIHNPELNNWGYSNSIKEELLKILQKRKEEFEDDENYDYSIEIVINYQISDKTSNHSSGDMEHHIKKSSKTKEEFEVGIEEISNELNRTFKEHLVIMYNFKVFNITLSCNFFVK